ncbi:MAG TPA: hypothetical protein VMG61_07045 [Usitatibacter sp.]|nr:hypothetical protein [Usitatibacter sp.]
MNTQDNATRANVNLHVMRGSLLSKDVRAGFTVNGAVETGPVSDDFGAMKDMAALMYLLNFEAIAAVGNDDDAFAPGRALPQ